MEKKLRIKDIYQSYIQKDVTDFLQIQNIDGYHKLLIRLSNQIGELLNINNLSNSLKLTRNEINTYLDVLEQTFICRKIFPYYKNYNKEITKTPKVYFLDLGLRNFIVSNFNSLDKRDDIGKLFENFYLTELLAKDYYSIQKINFWRTTNQTEVDFIVKDEDIFEAIEVKWNRTKSVKALKSFQFLYPEAKTRLVSSGDFSK